MRVPLIGVYTLTTVSRCGKLELERNRGGGAGSLPQEEEWMNARDRFMRIEALMAELLTSEASPGGLSGDKLEKVLQLVMKEVLDALEAYGQIDPIQKAG